MAELSRNQLRNPGADRRQRRNSLIPDRRDTEAPVRRASNDIRSGTRGDVGGADALLQLARQVNGTAKAFADRDDALFTKTQREDEARAGFDLQSGQIDPEKMKKSLAYRETVGLGRAQRTWLESIDSLDNKVKAVLNTNTDPDPAVREAAIMKVIDDHYKEFAIDPETNQVRDFGSAKAQRWLAEQMSAVRSKVMADSNAIIETKINEEILTDKAEIIRGKIRLNEPWSVEDIFVDLPGTIDRGVAKAAAIAVVKDEAAVLQAESERALEEGDLDKATELYNRSTSLLQGLRTSTRNKDRPDIVPVDVPASETPAAPTAAPAAAPAAIVEPLAGFSGLKPTSKKGAPRAGGKRKHNGEDYAVPVGTPVKAPMGGKVVHGSSEAGGIEVYLEMDNGDRLGLAHLSARSVANGTRVKAGDVIALSGNSGTSTGPHVHMTVTSKGKKVSPSDYFKNTAVAADPTTTQQMAGASRDVLDPPSVVEQLAKMAPSSNMGMFKGAYSLNAQERLEIGQIIRQNDKVMNAAFEKARRDKQLVNANDALLRLSGVGEPISVTEIQTKMQSGEISPTDGRQLLGIIEADQNEQETEARQAVSESETVDREAKEQRIKTAVDNLTGPVARGTMTVSEARSKLLEIAKQEPDPQVRQAIISSASEGLNGVANLRTKSPETRRAVNQLGEWEQQYLTDLARANVPQGKRKQAEANIKSWINDWAVQLSEGNFPPEGIPVFMKSAEEWLDAKMLKTYPPRKVTKQ